MATQNQQFVTNHEFSASAGTSMQEAYTGTFSDNWAIGGIIWNSAIDDIMQQEDCIGLRYYFIRSAASFNILILGIEKRTYNDITDIIRAGIPEFRDSELSVDTVDTENDEADESDMDSLRSDFSSAVDHRGNGGFFFRSIIDYFSDYPEAEGLRYRFGIDDAGNLKLILNPFDSNLENIEIRNAGNELIVCQMSNGGGGGGG